ncbi:MAG: right-handed parallel beta-helix repeat-containing protein, partial [Chitinivibrionales bacterium]|nr:right-handed parallel beta-helix repeat-containing protein [Chitinivibrionales bacterium]
SYITIRNNTVRLNRYTNYGGFGGIFLENCTNCLIENNTLTNSPNNRGIFCITSSNCIIRKNTIVRVGHTALSNYTCSMMQITDNLVDKCLGIHANGISLYLSCKDILVARNRIYDGTLTMESENGPTQNITIFGNILDAENTLPFIVANWSDLYEKILILNNTIIGTTDHEALMLEKNPVFIVKNNILDGSLIAGESSHNIYVGLMWNQQPSENWKKGTNYVMVAAKENRYIPYDVAKLLPGHTQRNYQPNPDYPEKSRLVADSGVNIRDLLPLKKFPDFDFSIDIAGNRWPSGNQWPIGALNDATDAMDKKKQKKSGLFKIQHIRNCMRFTFEPLSLNQIKVTFFTMTGKMLAREVIRAIPTADASVMLPLPVVLGKGSYLACVETNDEQFVQHVIIY